MSVPKVITEKGFVLTARAQAVSQTLYSQNIKGRLERDLP
jgi:hypothetical protein